MRVRCSDGAVLCVRKDTLRSSPYFTAYLELLRDNDILDLPPHAFFSSRVVRLGLDFLTNPTSLKTESLEVGMLLIQLGDYIGVEDVADFGAKQVVRLLEMKYRNS